MQGGRTSCTDSFLNPNPFHQYYGIKNVAKVKVNRESCMALLDNDTQINTIMPGFIENHSLDIGPLFRPSGQTSCLCRPREYTCLTYGLCHHMGSSGQSPWLWWRSDSPGDPRFVKLNGMGPCDPGTPMISHVMNVIKEETDNLVTPWVNAWVAISFGSLMSYSHGEWWQGCCWRVRL